MATESIFHQAAMMEISVMDVAKWFLGIQPLTHKKLQKLCYYAQAWHLALLNRSLFTETIQAWIHGPVIPALYAAYADYGWELIPQHKGERPGFPADTLEILETVWNTYKDFDGDQLEALTHDEEPWQNARKGLAFDQPGHKEISLEDMRAFYKQLWQDSQND